MGLFSERFLAAAGDPELSGCYCEHCMAKFTTVLEGLNASTRDRLNVSVSCSSQASHFTSNPLLLAISGSILTDCL